MNKETNTYILGNTIGKQRAMSIDIWLIPTIDSVIGYACVWTTVVAPEFSVLLTLFNTYPSYLKVSK